MHKPSYNEVVGGFGFWQQNFASAALLANTATYNFTNAQNSALQTHVAIIGDVGAWNGCQTADVTLGAKCAVAFALAMPVDVNAREFYNFAASVVGYSSASGVMVIPFVAYASGLTGGWNTVYLRYVPPLDYCFTGLGFGAGLKTTLRPTALPSVSDPAMTQLVFGLAVVNPTAAAVTLSAMRVSLDGVRFSEPDLVDVAGI